MGRQRVNPFEPGTAERVLFDRFRKADTAARKAERERDLAATEAGAYRAAANRYEDALIALGHGDKLPGPPQAQLPAPAEFRAAHFAGAGRRCGAIGCKHTRGGNTGRWTPTLPTCRLTISRTIWP